MFMTSDTDTEVAMRQLFPRGLLGLYVDARKLNIPTMELYARIMKNDFPMEVEAVRLQRICRESLASNQSGAIKE